MKTFLAISVINDPTNLDQTINSILTSNFSGKIIVFDATINGIGKEYVKFTRFYSKYGVFYERIKKARKLEENERINLSIASAVLRFNMFKETNFSNFAFIDSSIVFGDKNIDLNSLFEKSLIYHSLSPVLESINGTNALYGIFDRFGISYGEYKESTQYILTGKVEESYALNPKCFFMSKINANKLTRFTESDRDPVDYLNDLLYTQTNHVPKLDTSIFIHENLY